MLFSLGHAVLFIEGYITSTYLEKYLMTLVATNIRNKLGLSCAKLRTALASYILYGVLYLTELKKMAGA